MATEGFIWLPTAAAVTLALPRLLGQPAAGFWGLCISPKHSRGLCSVTPPWLPLPCAPTAGIGPPSPAPPLPALPSAWHVCVPFSLHSFTHSVIQVRFPELPL